MDGVYSINNIHTLRDYAAPMITVNIKTSFFD